MKKVTSKTQDKEKQRQYKKDTFKFAECISMMDIMETKGRNLGFFFYMVDKVMEVREREIARCKY